jgi:beta-1,4-mannosyltransferase
MNVLIMPFLNLAYFDLLKESLEARGNKVTSSWKFPRRGIFFGPKYDVIHIHMLDSLFLQENRLKSKLRIFYFKLVILNFAKLRKMKIVWTCHELKSHANWEREQLEFKSLSLWFAKISGAIIVHNLSMYEKLKDLVPECDVKKIHVVDFGHYVDYYRKFIARPMSELRIDPNIKYFVAAGYMRRNKGTDLTVEAFGRLQDPSARLLLVGGCESSDYLNELEGLAMGDDRVQIVAKNVSNEEMVWLHHQAYCMVFSFRDCPTSASVVTAMSLGKCVICPNLGHCSELLSGGFGFLYESNNPDSLTSAMKVALSDDGLVRQMGEKSMCKISEQTWKDISTATLKIYNN